MKKISDRIGKENIQYQLVEDPGKLLIDLNMYLPKLMNYLWEEPGIIAKTLECADPANDLKDILAPLFANDFYENIISSYYIEDNLIYLLTLLLKDEIEKLEDTKQQDKFLNNTPCGCLLNELRKKNDIQAFFKTIILKSIENLENEYSNLKLNLEIKKLDEIFKGKENAKKAMQKGYQKSASYDQSMNNYEELIIRDKQKFQSEQAKFNEKYIPSLDKTALENLANNNQNNKRMYDYLNSKIKDCQSDEDYYSNKYYLDELYKSNNSTELLAQYQYYFNIVKSFIDSILDNIINNLHLLPYSVKCLCKIISSLIVKKFPTINENEKNSFIARFCFGKLLIPILINPGIEAFIDNFIISNNTVDNLKTICLIIQKFTSGNFYIGTKEGDYTPFNWYFLEKIEKLFDMYAQITKVTLPSFIDKLINGELPIDYKYDYFKENPDEAINLRTICYNLEQVNVLLKIMSKNKNEIFKDKKNIGLQKTVEKLLSKDNQKMLNDLLNQEKLKKTKYFILMTNLLTSEKYKKILSIEQSTSNFTIKEIKSLSEENIAKNDIIRVKNFFCSLLYNYKQLIKKDFDIGTTGNTRNILIELNRYMKSSNFVVDGTIPSEWYVKSLLEYLEKIPKDLTENDCKKLYEEIKNDVNDSIKELDFEAISVITEKFKYIQRRKKYYDNTLQHLVNIKLNEETKDIIERCIISVDIIFDIKEEQLEENLENNLPIGEFDIIMSEKMDKKKIKEYEKKKIKIRRCPTIEVFTKKFPNLVKYQEMQDADILEIQQKLNFPAKLVDYFNIIKQVLEIRKIGGENSNSINEKIYDYVMGKVYDKVYPNEPHEKDNKIFQQSVRLSWTELKHFMKLKKKMVFGSFLTDVKELFQLIDSEKSPRKKFLHLAKINNSITFLLKFNGTGNDIGVDDQLPILNYVLAKSQQLRMYSNGKYMELYIGEKKNKLEGSQLTQLLSSCEFIANLTYSDLNDVTQEEFVNNCNYATNTDNTAKRLENK